MGKDVRWVEIRTRDRMDGGDPIAKQEDVLMDESGIGIPWHVGCDGWIFFPWSAVRWVRRWTVRS